MTTSDITLCSPNQLTDPLEALLPPERERLLLGLAGKLHHSLCAADQNLGHLEEQRLRGGSELFRQMLEKAAQQKADAAPPLCPHCQNKLRRLTDGHWTTIQTRFGPIRLQRPRGYFKRCRKWRFPADTLLGLPEAGTQAPAVQEIAALTVSPMPAAQAEHLVERLTGLNISAAPLGRQAHPQGQWAQEQRTHWDQQMSTPAGRAQQDRDLQLQLALEPFTLVIQLDAWNSRERDDWGQSPTLRARGQEPSRWHWVYGGTCFRLNQRAQTAGGRPEILSRGYAMTRGGVNALKQQLWAEAMRRGLGRANEVLIVADGAVWIWNLAGDQFPGARQRVDYYHVSQHLWSVARALHPDAADAARAWVGPMLERLQADASCEVITELEQLRERVEGAAREVVAREVGYLQTHGERLDYGTARQKGEPLGSGPIESPCRQYQVRFKRTGQFWRQAGDEALMCLETFRRNDRWHLLFPHARSGDPSKN
ncbi:MAG: ISKra4 family transposase [Verrucomicrobiae bacterium]|nr:ISKra4 family transposase [Verrucomicrobiae bacterium]